MTDEQIAIVERMRAAGKFTPDEDQQIVEMRRTGAGRRAGRCAMTGFAPFAETKIVPIDPAGGDLNLPRNYSESTPNYSKLLRTVSSYCISPISCLFNYPRHAIAPGGHEHRGAVVKTVSFKSEAASRDVRMLRRAKRPAITGHPEDLAVVDVMLNPKGNLSEEAQPVPNRCDDLCRHHRTDCRRMLSDRQRNEGRRQQAVHRRTRLQLLLAWEKSSAAPETAAPPAPSPCPNAFRCSKSPEPCMGSIRLAPGARHHDEGHSRCTDRCRKANGNHLFRGASALALPGRAGSRSSRNQPCTCQRAFEALAFSGGAGKTPRALGLPGGARCRGGRSVTSIVDIQDAYIVRVMAAFKKVRPHMRGKRFARTTRAARKQAITRLVKHGYSARAATKIIDDVHEVFLLEAAAMRGAS